LLNHVVSFAISFLVNAIVYLAVCPPQFGTERRKLFFGLRLTFVNVSHHARTEFFQDAFYTFGISRVAK